MYFAIILTLFVSAAYGANILGLFFHPSFSHQTVYQKIWRELALRGHKVTVLTTEPIRDPTLQNLKEIDLSFTYKLVEGYGKKAIKGANPKDTFRELLDLNFLVTKQVLNNTEVKSLLWDDSLKFDLVLRESINPITLAFAHKFQSPVVDISATDIFSYVNDRVGNPNHPVLYPEPYFDYVPGKLAVWQKYQSLSFFLWHKYYYYNVFLPSFDRLAREILDFEFPYLGDLEINISMLLVNRNFLLHAPRPNVPACIEISPVQAKTTESLPQDLKKFLDEAKKGVVYVSFGSEIKTSYLDKNLISKMLQAFGELPYKFIMKADKEFLAGQPSNVFIRKWLPQKEILGHPNVKAFITQGGQQSVEEAILKKVPIIGIPFGWDQPRNLRRVVELKIGERIFPHHVTKSNLKSLITKVSENKFYRDNLNEAQDLLTDKPMTGLDTAVWWSEYVIRHKGARHLRSAAIEMPWYQYLLLDVIGFLITVTLLGLYIVSKLLGFVLALFKRKATKKLKTN